MNKQKIIIITLSIALFLIVQYVIIENWLVGVREDMIASYQNGYNAGAKDALTAIYQQTMECQTSTITLGNFTRQVFDTTCLQDNPGGKHP